MFKIVDGRECFYQWDLDRQIEVEDATITEVHFCNRTDDCSLVVEVVDGVANVPNVILQKSFNVRVFGYDGKATRYDKVFEVKARSKPSDYVYTETEVKRWEDLEKRVDSKISQMDEAEAGRNKKVDDKIAELDASETERIAAEQTRVVAEEARVIAEQGRVDAETDRNTTFNTLSTDMSAATVRAEELIEGLSNYDSTIDNHGNRITANEVKADNHEKRITNIERHISNDYFVTDNSIAYNKAVGVDVCPYAQLNNIGGMTYKCNNLIPFTYRDKSKTSNGITFTVNDDGTVLVNGTATARAELSLGSIKCKAGTYTLSGCPVNNGGQYALLTYNGGDSKGTGHTFTFNEEKSIGFTIRIEAGVVADNLLFKPMLNEGSTALPYEPYYEGLRDTKVTEIVSEGVNRFNTDWQPTLSSIDIYEKTSETSFKVIINKSISSTSAYSNIKFNNIKCNGRDTICFSCVMMPFGKLTQGRVVIYLRDKYGEALLSRDKVTSGKYTTSITDIRSNYPTAEYLDMAFYSVAGQLCDMGDGVEYSDVMLTFDAPLPTECVPYKEPISYPIPAEIQALDVLGDGINENCYNYIDYEKKQYIKRVNRIVLNGTEQWDYNLSNSARFRCVGVIKKEPAASYSKKCLCNKYTHNSKVYSDSNREDGIVVANAGLLIRDASYTTIEDFKAYLAEQYANGTPLTAVYQLATPEIIDISEYLKDFDNLIEVEGGGSLEFVNEYKNAVTSSISYLLKEGSI